MRHLCQFIYLFPDLDVFAVPWFPEIHFPATLFICVLKATIERGDFVCISVIFQPFTGYNWMYVNLLWKSRVLVRSIYLLDFYVLSYICPSFLCRVPSYHYIGCFSFEIWASFYYSFGLFHSSVILNNYTGWLSFFVLFLFESLVGFLLNYCFFCGFSPVIMCYSLTFSDDLKHWLAE